MEDQNVENGLNQKDDRGTISTTNDVSLPGKVLDQLYERYSIKQRRSGLPVFLGASILFCLWALIVPYGQTTRDWITYGILLLLNILVLGIIKFFDGKETRYSEILWRISSSIACILFAIQFLLYMGQQHQASRSVRDSLGWGILTIFLFFITAPVPLWYTGLILCASLYTKYIMETDQIIVDTILLTASGLIGLLCYLLGEFKQRRAFLEAKQSLEVKMLIEEQSAEQERLLLSVLPEHLAVKMREDLGSNNSEQFKKIYMSRHENVSILYADIVGFTAISSTYCAQDLVKMLNELFARFDRLAEKYHQLRIKILGDCYYCISGAPVERPDHAVLCVHMGLSMVKAIKYVQQKTNSPVDMRVGIHTGAILAGILGQRQWQFDIYSKDVELANKMESSGKAGRVHISEKTLGFLPEGHFEVEPAFGERREETLRIAGIKTYFISKVLKPFTTDVPAKVSNGQPPITDALSPIESDGPSDISNKFDENTRLDCEENLSQKENDFKLRLQKELVSRDGHGELSKVASVFLTFKDSEIETAYVNNRAPLSTMPLLAAILVHIVGIIQFICLFKLSMIQWITMSVVLLVIILLASISVAESFQTFFKFQICPIGLRKFSKCFNDIVWLRRLTALLIIILVALSSIVNIHQYHAINDDEQSAGKFPSYYVNYCVLILIATSIIAQFSHLLKILLMALITGLHCALVFMIMDHDLRIENYLNPKEYIDSFMYGLVGLLVAVTFALSFLARHFDRVDRVIFVWQTEVKEQKEKASDMRRRNEALVYNVLPVHVAEHFMKNRQHSYDELYSQSYSEVGVLFASMPNFSDFYSEETVNNQGLECLRFLNEVISDFDALLELPQFHDIIKIKTISSTYMAASGLNLTSESKQDDPILKRWKHLATLVDFALELKKALTGINEQSFNHFVLKMGINHGPITAGVIGARKPHYDIWGNTVNVASRMESTGKAGAIQVTQETCEILSVFGYTFEQRGLVSVKGKGQLMTYYLIGKEDISHTNPSTNTASKESLNDEKDDGVTEKALNPMIGNENSINSSTTVSSPSTSQNSVKFKIVDTINMSNGDNLDSTKQIVGSDNINLIDNDMDNLSNTPLLEKQNETDSSETNLASEKDSLLIKSG